MTFKRINFLNGTAERFYVDGNRMSKDIYDFKYELERVSGKRYSCFRTQSLPMCKPTRIEHSFCMD